MNDWSNCINLVNDNVNVYSTNSIATADSRMVGVTFGVSSSSWVLLSGSLLVICVFVSFFIRQLTLRCFFQ